MEFKNYSTEELFNFYKAELASNIESENQSCLKAFFDDYEKLIKTLPASADHHSSCDSGWLIHTMYVYYLAVILSGALKLDNKECASLKCCALLHDIGKLGTAENPGYQKKDGKWTVNPYYHSKMPHELRSIYIIHDYGITLTEKEFTAIVYHAGLYDHNIKTFGRIENNLSLLLHTADNLAAKLMG